MSRGHMILAAFFFNPQGDHRVSWRHPRAPGREFMKIDRSLVVAVSRDENGGAVLQATVALANALHLPVTAEGIETEEQAAAVRLSGCDKLQGYLFCKPLPAAELTARYFARGVEELPQAV